MKKYQNDRIFKNWLTMFSIVLVGLTLFSLGMARAEIEPPTDFTLQKTALRQIDEELIQLYAEKAATLINMERLRKDLRILVDREFGSSCSSSSDMGIHSYCHQNLELLRQNINLYETEVAYGESVLDGLTSSIAELEAKRPKLVEEIAAAQAIDQIVRGVVFQSCGLAGVVDFLDSARREGKELTESELASMYQVIFMLNGSLCTRTDMEATRDKGSTLDGAERNSIFQSPSTGLTGIEAQRLHSF